MPMRPQDVIAKAVARHIAPGSVVNLGIGIPTLVADHLPTNSGICLQTENGMLGVGPSPTGQIDPDLVNAGRQPVTETVGATYFSSSESFAMIRGGRIDVAVLGALEVSETGHLANWSIPGKRILGVGGAMDLLIGGKQVIVATTHLTKHGSPKIVARCEAPLTGERPVELVVTEHATFALREGVLWLTELREVDIDWLRAHTGARFEVDRLVGDQASDRRSVVDEHEPGRLRAGQPRGTKNPA
jgi:3-oxoacid CoA-transferase B subunit